MNIKEKIAIRMMMFIVRMCLSYSFTEEFKKLNQDLDVLLKEEIK